MSNLEVGLGIDKSGSDAGFFKPGYIISYIGSTVPNGWLLCDGRAVSRTIYSNLWDAVKGSGSTGIYGNGDGSITFNLPDFSNRFVYIGTTGSGGSLTHQHTVNASAVAGVTGLNHTHNNTITGTGGVSTGHTHFGASNIGYNGTNPTNANKTGTGGAGVANGGAHVHGAYSAGYSYDNGSVVHGHSPASLGLNSHYSEHGAYHTAAVSGTSDPTAQVMPYYAVYFLVKI